MGVRRKPLQFWLNLHNGVPAYRQIIDQVASGLATGALSEGDQLPTVRQLAVDLSINPNTVVRAYRELEIRGIIETQQGTGTFVGQRKTNRDGAERERRLNQLVSELVARAGAEGFSVEELAEELREFRTESGKRRR